MRISKLLLLLLISSLMVSACSVIAPSPPTVPIESDMEGMFQLEFLSIHDARVRGIEVLDCGDTVTFLALPGSGTATYVGESSLLLKMCFPLLSSNTEGTGTLTAENGDTLLLSLTGGLVQNGPVIDYKIVGGSGKFFGAAGNGKMFLRGESSEVAGRFLRPYVLEGTIVTQRLQTD